MLIKVLNTKNDSRLTVRRNRDTSHDHSPCLKISFQFDLMANFTQDLKRFEALQHGCQLESYITIRQGSHMRLFRKIINEGHDS